MRGSTRWRARTGMVIKKVGADWVSDMPVAYLKVFCSFEPTTSRKMKCSQYDNTLYKIDYRNLAEGSFISDGRCFLVIEKGLIPHLINNSRKANQ